LDNNAEQLEIEITEPKKHFYSRQKKSIVHITKPIKGGQGWKDRVYSNRYVSYNMMDDLFMWMVVYYPMISEVFDFNSAVSTIEVAEIIDNSPHEHEMNPIDTTPEPDRESLTVESRHKSYESHESHESYKTHDIGDHHVSHDDYSSSSYDSGSSGGGDSGGSCGGCD
jgi:hypothetical protein